MKSFCPMSSLYNCIKRETALGICDILLSLNSNTLKLISLPMLAGINSNCVSFKQSSSKDNTCVKGIGNIEIGLALKFKIESFLQFLMFSSIVGKSKKKTNNKNI